MYKLYRGYDDVVGVLIVENERTCKCAVVCFDPTDAQVEAVINDLKEWPALPPHTVDMPANWQYNIYGLAEDFDLFEFWEVYPNDETEFS